MAFWKYLLSGTLAAALVAAAAVGPEYLLRRQDRLDTQTVLDRTEVTVTSDFQSDLSWRLCLLADYYGESNGQRLLVTYDDTVENWETLSGRCTEALRHLTDWKVLPELLMAEWEESGPALSVVNLLRFYDKQEGQWCSFAEVSCGGLPSYSLSFLVDIESGLIVRLGFWWENGAETYGTDSWGEQLESFAAYLGMTAETTAGENLPYLEERRDYSQEVGNKASWLTVRLPDGNRTVTFYEEVMVNAYEIMPLAWADLSG